MFRQSAPWLKKAPHYTPLERSREFDCSPVVRRAPHGGIHNRSAANYQFIVTNAENPEEDAQKHRLCKKDFKRLRRYQNCRMRMASAFRVVAVAMLMVWWLVPIYLMSHAAAVCAVAYKCGTLLQAALANSTLKTWLGTFRTA